MAKVSGVWGIDIGQCALKALRCRRHDDDPQKIVAESFDYIEYSKILSQPDADPAALIKEALEQFLSRNELAGDRVAISVSGQSGLVRFIKLPPVESKKIPDIVKYEARQQIPFALEDVVWDYQQMAGGSEDDGFALETEVGLFAMKRDQVYRALEPFNEVGIPVDLIQLSPLAIFNYIVFDDFPDLPPVEDYDPEDPPHSTVVLSIGTDNTDLVVTNGFRVWQRNIPIGGNHFTKALTKELRLTFSKAEHLKRHAKEAENAKAVFQAMRPVFSDLLTEVQRSLGFFAGLDRHARISRIVGLGNAMKLPGLRRYLTQNLEYDLQPSSTFRSLDGPSIIDNPQFKSNQLSFGTCYGLCLQALGIATISTNLLPPEIVTERLVRAKKPWVVGAVAATLLGCTINFAGHWAAWSSADLVRFESAFAQVSTATSLSRGFQSDHTAAEQQREQINQIGNNLVSNVEGRLRWLELLRAIDAALPSDPPQVEAAPEAAAADPTVIAENGEKKKSIPIDKRRELHIEAVNCEWFEDVSVWRQAMEPKHNEDHGVVSESESGDVDDTFSGSVPSDAAGDGAASDSGWVIQLSGYHFHNADPRTRGPAFVRQTLLKELEEGSVQLPTGNNGELEDVPMTDLGISFPVLVDGPRLVDHWIDDRDKIAEFENKRAEIERNVNRNLLTGSRTDSTSFAPPKIRLKRFNFVVQFCWQPTTGAERIELAENRKLAEQQKAAELAANNTSSGQQPDTELE